MIIINWGGGTNSTALVIEALNRGFKIDLILFADTGAEMPHTYQFKTEFEAWLSLRGLSLVTVRWERVRGDRLGFIPLDEYYLWLGDVPSPAYNGKLRGCSVKFKQHPADAYARQFCEGHPGTVERWLGYDASEYHRGIGIIGDPRQGTLFAADTKPGAWVWRAPLREWDIDRDGCAEIIRRAGLSQPGKSSCYLCPFMKPAEIMALHKEHPDLMQKALAVEDKARPGLTSIKGLGHDFTWRGLIEKGEVGRGVSDSDGACNCFDDSDLPLFGGKL